jgi:hypothetical protein
MYLEPGCYASFGNGRWTSLTTSPGCWHACPVGITAVFSLAPGCSPRQLEPEIWPPAGVPDRDGDTGIPRARSAQLFRSVRPDAMCP